MKTKSFYRIGIFPLVSLIAAGACSRLTPRAWCDDPAPPNNLVKPLSDYSSWYLVKIEGADGEAATDGAAQRYNITALGPHSWDALLQGECDLTEGQTYTLKFKAKADMTRSLPITEVIDHPDYHMIGSSQSVVLATEWKQFTLTFKASGTDAGRDAIQFQFGDKTGTIWISDVSLIAGVAVETAQPAAPPYADPLPPALRPGTDEVRLQGKVVRVLPGGKEILILASQVAETGQAPVTLHPPRQKVILVTASASILTGNGPRSALNVFHKGDMVVTVGKSGGDGKPLAARVVASSSYVQMTSIPQASTGTP